MARMLHILGEAPNPSMSRTSVGVNQPSTIGAHLSHVTIENVARGRGDVWLPPTVMAEKDLDAIRRVLTVVAMHAVRGDYASSELLMKTFTGARMEPESGCWEVSGQLRSVRRDDELHTKLLWRALGEETGYGVLTPPDQKLDKQLCETPQCLNVRHYNVIHGLQNRDRLIEPDYRLYQSLPDGSIETAWGDVLPSVAFSRERLVDLQRRCPPYVTHGPLTFSGISKIGFDEETGCWPASSYYSRIRTGEDSATWQFDGYGRIGINALLRASLNLKKKSAAQTVAHRVTWLVEGNGFEYDTAGNMMVLNHMCGFRRCCNPYHLEQITHTENVRHGERMTAAIKMVNAGFWRQATLL